MAQFRYNNVANTAIGLGQNLASSFLGNNSYSFLPTSMGPNAVDFAKEAKLYNGLNTQSNVNQSINNTANNSLGNSFTSGGNGVLSSKTTIRTDANGDTIIEQDPSLMSKVGGVVNLAGNAFNSFMNYKNYKLQKAQVQQQMQINADQHNRWKQENARMDANRKAQTEAYQNGASAF